MNLTDIKERMDSIDWEAIIDKQNKKEAIVKSQINRAIDKLLKLGKTKRLQLFQKVYSKYNSNYYINREYMCGREPRTVLYDLIYEYALQYGTHLENEDGYIIDNCWYIEIVFGQGSKIIFEKVNDIDLTDTDIIIDILNSNDIIHSFDVGKYRIEKSNDNLYCIVLAQNSYTKPDVNISLTYYEFYKSEHGWSTSQSIHDYSENFITNKMDCLTRMKYYINNTYLGLFKP